MNSEKYRELIDQYTEALIGYHEIEFKYNNHTYSLERDSETQYVIWQFEPGASSGIKIATASTPEELLELKCFNGKAVFEIEDDVTDSIIF